MLLNLRVYTFMSSQQKYPSSPRVISVTSGKGGVGKTHTTVNLGLALTKLGKKVLLIDADLGLANINVIMGFEPKAHIGSILNNTQNLDAVLVSHESGLDILPASSGVAELTNLSEGNRVHIMSALEQLTKSYDYVLIDTAAGIGDNVLFFNSSAEQILVVIDPEPTSLTDAYALMKVLSQQCHVKSFTIIANKIPQGSDGRTVYQQVSAVSGKYLDVSLKYLGAIREDSSVRDSVRAQKPFLQLFPSSKASLDIQALAKKLDESERPAQVSGNPQFFLERRL
jgi:flagellar biosynthesis protein FlhG